MFSKKIVVNRDFCLWVIFATSLLFLASFLLWLVIVCLYNGTNMNTFAANGTFQLYNPLRRLVAGQTIGYDFPFFHGIGVPFLHLPVFKLLGSGVFAAETAKWIISPLIFLFSSFVFFYAFFKDIKKSTIALALFTIMALKWVDVIWPGNSLIGIRGTLPILVSAALLWKTNYRIKIKQYSIHLNEAIALIILGISPLFGTEQGIAAILAYALINFVFILRNKSEKRIHEIIHLAIKGLVIIAVALLAYTVLTKGHPLSAIKYALIDVPTDQAWYFGTDAQGFLIWGNLLVGLFHFNMRYMWMTIILGGVAMFIFLKKIKNKSLEKTLWFMLTYGVVAFVVTVMGYYSPSSQLIPLQRVMSIVLITLFVSLIFSDRAWHQNHTSNHLLRHAKISALVISITIAIYTPLNIAYVKLVEVKAFDVSSILRVAREARHSNDYFVSSEGWKSSIDSFRPYIRPNKTIWSMYTSVYDTVFGDQLNPSNGGEDYIIHALGDQRRASYESDFIDMKPHYVITIKPSYFDFEEWLWANHWNIYKNIFSKYDLVAENASHYLWEINNTPQTDNNTTYSARITPKTIFLPGNNTKTPIVYSINIKYDAHTAIGLMDKLPRYLIKINNRYIAQRYRISLPSHKQEWTFPVIVMPGEDTVELTASTEGIMPFADLTINSATYTQTTISPNNIKPIENNACWIHHKEGLPVNYPWTCDPTTQKLTIK